MADNSPAFLTLLDTFELALNDTIEIIAVREYDKSLNVTLDGRITTTLSREISQNLPVV